MNQKYALITGSSSGLGYAMAQYLLDEGLTVFGISRSGTDIEHGNFIDLLADIRDEVSVEELFSQIEKSTGTLDLVVLNAGVCTLDPILETSTKDFQNHLDTYVLGAFHILKHVGEFLIERQTQIVSISSLAGLRGYPNLAAFSSAKFALEGLIESCKLEWRESQIKFTTLYAGPIDTPLWDELDSEVPEDSFMSIDDFIYVFDFILKAPSHVKIPKLVFHALGDVD